MSGAPPRCWWRAVGLVGLLLAGVAPGCSLPNRDSGAGYQLTAHFERTIGLYPHGDVSLMGIDVGEVDDVVLTDTGVEVEMTIDDDVPLPADVRATIEAQSLIGERTVVLFPAWDESRQGGPRADDGDVIPLQRTTVPVEPDEGLAAFNELARSLQPQAVNDLVSASADVLEGRGEQLGAAIDDAAQLAGTFAQLDQQLVGAAESLRHLAGSLNTRQTQLQSLVDTFAGATDVLASERDGIRTFLQSLVALTEEGQHLLDLHGDHLPLDVARLAAAAQVLNRNSGALEQAIAGLPGMAEGIAKSYSPAIDGITLRSNASTSLRAFADNVRDLVGDLFGGTSP